MFTELVWFRENGYEDKAEHFNSTLDPTEVAEIHYYLKQDDLSPAV